MSNRSSGPAGELPAGMSAVIASADEAKAAAEGSGRWSSPVVTEIVPAGPFYRAEAFHQDYLERNPGGYTCHYLRD